MEKRDTEPQSPIVSGDRPRYAAESSQSKYKCGDEIYLDKPGSRSLAGPYLISSVPSKGKYVLCLENGDKVEGGTEFDESNLQKK
ncbi:MAG: hypothetical protein Q9180_008891 [Flavoplaca navasiana]